ncbi:interleukin-1 receptor type 2 [Embiotoca jacksoni]|uniref:interleukin-1 receptor type 2 n=1 Tax=Embiotoca jacksoni TaxID=100190 RepID=UPI0037040229
MVCLALMFTVLIIDYVYGGPPLPPLPMKDGCYLVSSEVEIFRVEREAVILYFPIFTRVLEVRKISPPSAKYLISKNNGTEDTTYQGEGRVQQRDQQLWLLPAQASDSGKYTCTYRNESYCVTGSIDLYVYESASVDVEKLFYPVSATVGEKVNFSCPSLSYFNKTNSLIKWQKDDCPSTLQPCGAGSFHQDNGNLMIPDVKSSHAGVYTCLLRVLINNQQHKVSRTIQLHVEGTDPASTSMKTEPDLTATSDPGQISSTDYVVIMRPPVIVSPLNGTIFESSHGSVLELFCKVLTECQTAYSTEVAWLVNGKSVESSYEDRQGIRVTRVSEGCHIELRLVVADITEEDVKMEMKCIAQNMGGRQEIGVQLQLEDTTLTWLVVAVVAVSCFLTVVSIFLCVLFKPKRKKKMDYFLARQSSTF